MTRLGRAAAVSLTVGLGCGSSGASSDGGCPGQTRQLLVNASPREVYLGISAAEQRAIVAIVDPSIEGSTCSGVFVAPTWVLTAAHCDELADAEVRVSASERSPATRLRVVRRALAKAADVALFQVAPAAPADLVSIGVPGRELGALVPGAAVELAGFGRNEAGTAGDLGFLVEQVLALGPSHVTVAGFGRSGACDGDSGGPLLMRDEAGSLVVAGVLSRGSTTCLHEDEYVRTDVSAVRDFIRKTADVEVGRARACGTISAAGRCLYGSAVWCDGDVLSAESCAADRVCGWSEAASGYRCVPSHEPCTADEIGECRDGQSVRCVAGTIHREYCGPCGSCRVDGQTGAPFCDTLRD